MQTMEDLLGSWSTCEDKTTTWLSIDHLFFPRAKKASSCLPLRQAVDGLVMDQLVGRILRITCAAMVQQSWESITARVHAIWTTTEAIMVAKTEVMASETAWTSARRNINLLSTNSKQVHLAPMWRVPAMMLDYSKAMPFSHRLAWKATAVSRLETSAQQPTLSRQLSSTEPLQTWLEGDLLGQKCSWHLSQTTSRPMERSMLAAATEQQHTTNLKERD